MKRIVGTILAGLIVITNIAVVSHHTFARVGPSAATAASVTPIFVIPTAGATYPSGRPYLFQVQPIDGAVGYLWSFVQGGVIVYQNLAMDGHLSQATYTIAVNSAAHRQIHSGDLRIWVRALMHDGRWSSSGAVAVHIQGTAPRSTPTSIPEPTPRPTTATRWGVAVADRANRAKGLGD
jgi:hypothetical protein